MKTKASEAADRVTYAIRLIHEDMTIASGYKAIGDPHRRAELMRSLAVEYRAHRAFLLSTVGDFLESPTLEICGPDE